MTIRTVNKLGPYFAEIQCNGPYSMAAFVDVVDKALDYAASHDRSAVLVDALGITGGPDPAERVELAANSAELQLGKDRLVAIAIVGEEPMLHPERIGEAVALDRCAILKVFEAREAAIDWLEHTSG
jgi:hypothetical protein